MAAAVVWVGEVKSALYLTVSKKYTTYLARSGKRGSELALTHGATLVIVDAHSLHTTGQRILTTLQKQLPCAAFLLITEQPILCPEVAVVPPDISPRRLMQQVNRLMAAAPSQMIPFGGAHLDVAGGACCLQAAK
jgi:hypothetical protein